MPDPSFIFHEFQPFAVNFHDVKEVEAYDRKQGTNQEGMRRLISRLGIGEGDHVIDFGCGTGALAIQAESVCRCESLCMKLIRHSKSANAGASACRQ